MFRLLKRNIYYCNTNVKSIAYKTLVSFSDHYSSMALLSGIPTSTQTLRNLNRSKIGLPDSQFVITAVNPALLQS